LTTRKNVRGKPAPFCGRITGDGKEEKSVVTFRMRDSTEKYLTKKKKRGTTNFTT